MSRWFNKFVLGYVDNDAFYTEKYKDILEFVPNNNNKIKDIFLYAKNELVDSIQTYAIEENKIKFIVSLSGGVDSMVLATALCMLGYNVVGCHINYNNRAETKEEQKFMEEWCKYNNIKLYVKTIDNLVRGQVKRSEYEIYTRNIRFDFYKKILSNENCDTILLGHHKDDIVENVVANVCRGRNLLDLAVLKKYSIVNGVKLVRPMMDFYKDDVYKYADNYQVPYFKDTTPEWSVRGKYRIGLHPKLEDTFGKNVKENLLGLSKQSSEWNKLIMDKIIDPFLDTLVYTDYGVVFNLEKYIDYPICFWNIAFAKIFYAFGKNCPSRKGIITFTSSIHGQNQVSLGESCICKIQNYNVSIKFKA
jgi:tRNA(Ile)-lysidine synthetase-like protein